MDEDKEYYRALRRMYQAQENRAIVEELIEYTKPFSMKNTHTVKDFLEKTKNEN